LDERTPRFPDGGKISMIFGTGATALMNHDRYCPGPPGGAVTRPYRFPK
jgi:hypothetical protein